MGLWCSLIGLQLAMIGLGARYNWGVTDITPNAGNINNRYLELGVHLHLRK